eukprot:CAMPEP_0113491582 /NCGR_PEP_ID=MMETSP0014_2-20120614/27629_1 /TAXON_ID=2857 /ORGANISM="Nitzschia sp." /LENGTH=443 /DNA_ID=CAMNT_0000385375 /DNA_START=19 /DNA_END=1351 /DNA_ORIENTATION=- /assembly_acc=CAM_ASM_000159
MTSTTTNCWPWMKGVVDLTKSKSKSKSNPKTNTNDDNNNNNNIKDARPVIHDLIVQNRELIDQLKARLEEWASYGSSSLKFDPVGKHDDFWCLRFLLSHKFNVDKATKAACTTLDFRHKHSIDDWGDIRHLPPQDVNWMVAGSGSGSGPGSSESEQQNGGSSRAFLDMDGTDDDGDDAVTTSTATKASMKAAKGFAKFMECGGVKDQSLNSMFGRTVTSTTTTVMAADEDPPVSPTNTVVTYIDIGKLDTHVLGSNLDVDDWVAGLTYVNEYNYQWLDYLSRTSDRLTKSIRIVSLQSASIQQVDFTCQQCYTKATQQMEDCYPQAVAQIYVCFAPSWIYVPWKAIKPLLPQRVVSKIDFLHPLQNEDDLQTILTKVPKMMLPTSFGGSNTKIFPKEDRDGGVNSKNDHDDGDYDGEDEFVDAIQPTFEQFHLNGEREPYTVP